MRITHVITRLIVGGAQENTIASVLGLRRKFHAEVQLISGPTLGPEGSLVGEVAPIPELLITLPDLVRPISPWRDWVAWRQLVCLLRQLRPEIVHTHSGKAGVLGRLAARKAGVPVVVHTIHGPSFGQFQGALANQLFEAAERVAARSTTHFVTVADAMTRQYLAAGIGAPGQFTRIPSGFDLAPFLAARDDLELRARYGINSGDFVVGKIARLFKLKGHEDLFSAAPQIVRDCPEAKFLLVGDGAWRARFEAQARDLGLERHFIFAGLVPPAEVPALIGIMDVLVHLSRREGLARALPQALAAGKPVVAYDADGANEVCLSGQTGFLLPMGDRAQLISRIVQLARDPALRADLGRRGRTLVREQFGVEKMIDDLYALYRRLLSAADRT
jgi:glycosyltransferase involved in cell wall biosynthesis